MKKLGSLFAASALCALLAAPALAERLSPAEFVDEASALGLAEIETAKLALEKGSSADVKSFAQQMIDDHTKANKELTDVAQQKNLEVADDAALMSKAKAMILQLRDGESFDAAYANNQVEAHEKTIALFKDEIQNGTDPELKQYATETLPKLESHLEMARKLATQHAAGN